MGPSSVLILCFGLLIALPASATADEGLVDLSRATVVIRGGELPAAEAMAGQMLQEEIERRTGIKLPITSTWPDRAGAIIAITTRDGDAAWKDRRPPRATSEVLSHKEGYTVSVSPNSGNKPAVVIVTGADARGAMFGAGCVLRNLNWGPGSLKLNANMNVETYPAYPIRGHQLGYRDRSNTYDAWTPARYEQSIRELVVFGANCIESIPFHDNRPSPYMPIPRAQMNAAVAEICDRYDVDHWAWVPVDIHLPDDAKLTALLRDHEAFYRSCKRLDALFVPGGDPGENPARLLLPVLRQMADQLVKYHPRAKIWLSLQQFKPADIEFFYAFLAEQQPDWFGGVVMGPSSPPLNETRARLPQRYGLRWYPDITHTVRCQYPIPWWDPALAHTIGREPMTPRPTAFASILRQQIALTNGFITYSDGVNDDLNKTVWSMLGWNPNRNARDVLVEYSRFFFGSDVDSPAADGLLALERDWNGSLAENGAVEGTLRLWQELEEKSPGLKGNWRFEMHLLLAYYNAAVRRRLLCESAVEKRALDKLARASQVGADEAMNLALAILAKSEAECWQAVLHERIYALGKSLFDSIGYQTRSQPEGPNKGLVLDDLERPLNNRWWLEDEFAKVRRLSTEGDKLARLEILRTWEEPGPGSFYDEIGHVGKSPHVVTCSRGRVSNSQNLTDPGPQHMRWDGGRSRLRLAWQHFMRWPLALEYEGLDANAGYKVRLTGRGASRLRGDDVLLKPLVQGTEIGAFQEFEVPAELLQDRKLRLTWDDVDESHLNWRLHSHVAEVWLLRIP